MLGTLYIISAPSGCGKTSLVNAVLQSTTNMTVSISTTTRPSRPGEQEGVNYYFVRQDNFDDMIVKQEFLEHAEVFGYSYGTSRTKVVEKLEQGIDVVLEIDWQGARQIRERFLNTVSIFILPPSRETLRQRLQSRRQDNESIIEKRMALAHEELSHYYEYDYIIFNDNFDYALSDLNAIVHARRLRLDFQKERYQNLITELLNPEL
jgi:guanylate kinase